MKNKPELLAPAGSFSSAIYAFKYGADAVYLGLDDFSARKAAKNFSFDQLRRLKKYADENRKKIYVALNTVIVEKELNFLHKTLEKLSILAVDGVIIQDIGMLFLLQRQFPDIPVHASTQMAVHNSAGIEILKEEGIRRVILSRELSLREIKALKKEHPDMEMEVFIHGALCYSFSGLCLASGKMLGRSANRGECAQVCRTWFKNQQLPLKEVVCKPRPIGVYSAAKAAKKRNIHKAKPYPITATGGGGFSSSEYGKHYYFSMKDLAAYKFIRTLEDIGITSLKIEGRMKSPEYTGSTVELYRKILDNTIDPEHWEQNSENSRTIFSRHQNDNWLAGRFKSLIVDNFYPSHRGVIAGTVRKTSRNSFTVKLETEFSVRDGLMFFKMGHPPVPVNFGIKKMSSGAGKNITSADRGEIIKIYHSRIPEQGQLIYKTSSHKLNWPKIKENSYPLWKKKLDIFIRLQENRIRISAGTGNINISYENSLTVERANNVKDFRKLLKKIFEASDESWFICASLEFINETGLEDDRIFIPPGNLKKIKKEFYTKADMLLEGPSVHHYSRQSIHLKKTKEEYCEERPVRRSFLIPKTHNPIPFVLFHKKFPLSDLPVVEDKIYLPLMPVLFNSANYFTEIVKLLEAHTDREFVLGLNNAAHIKWAQNLSCYPNVSFFIDYGMYVANSLSYQFLLRKIPKIEFFYFWIEGAETDYSNLINTSAAENSRKPPVYSVDKDFKPHLFLSRVCYTNNLNNGKCPENCPKSFSYSLSQPGRRYKVIVEDCLTWLFNIP